MKIFKTLLLLFAVLAATSCSDDKDNQSSEKQIISFSINEVDAVINQSDLTISLALPKGTDLTDLLTKIVVSDKATVSPASNVHMDFSSPVNYTVKAEDGSTQTYKVTVTSSKSNEAKIYSFVIKLNPLTQFEAVIDEDTKTISVELPYALDVSALTPTLVISQDATVSPESGKTVNFTSPVDYKVTAEDGTTQTYTVKTTKASFPTQIRSLDKSSYRTGDQIEINGVFASSGNEVYISNGVINMLLPIYKEKSNTIIVSLSDIMDAGEYDLFVTSNETKVKYENKLKVEPSIITKIDDVNVSKSGWIKVTVSENNLNDLNVVLHGIQPTTGAYAVSMALKEGNSFYIDPWNIPVGTYRITISKNFVYMGSYESYIEIKEPKPTNFAITQENNYIYITGTDLHRDMEIYLNSQLVENQSVRMIIGEPYELWASVQNSGSYTLEVKDKTNGKIYYTTHITIN